MLSPSKHENTVQIPSSRKQAEGRQIFWDKTPDELAQRERMVAGSVPQTPYVYQTE